MTATDTLITADEVISYAPTDSHNDAWAMCTHIQTKEEKLFNDCLGWDFYVALMADKVDYSSASAFIENHAYAVDEVVIWNGVLYKCTAITTNQIPSNKNYWTLAPKFTNADYNYFWERYLRKVIAWSVLYTSVIYRAIRDTAIGLVRRKSEEADPADLKELFAVKHEAMLDIKDILRNMDIYLKRVPEDFPLYPPNDTALNDCKDGTCAQIKKKRHRGFNTRGSKYAVYHDEP